MARISNPTRIRPEAQRSGARSLNQGKKRHWPSQSSYKAATREAVTSGSPGKRCTNAIEGKIGTTPRPGNARTTQSCSAV